MEEKIGTQDAEGGIDPVGAEGGADLVVRGIPKAENPGLRSPQVPNKGPATISGRRTQLALPRPALPGPGPFPERCPGLIPAQSRRDPDPGPGGRTKEPPSRRRRRLRERRPRACAPGLAPSPIHRARSANGAAPQRQRCQ